MDAAFTQIGENDEQVGVTPDDGHLVLGAPGPGEILIKKAGYVFIFVSNENPTRVDVYFDDLTIEHVKSPLVQMDDYYPFGLAFNSYQRENTTPQDYKYNGKEEQDELALGWLDYGLRMYQPELGRWNGVDPLADKYLDISPFVYVAYNPVMFVDPNGAEIWLSLTYQMFGA